MKIIHAADIHLGSPLNKGFPAAVAEDISLSVRDTFRKMVEYAADNGAKAILLAGDVFDSDIPSSKDREFFYAVIKDNPSIGFYYLRGNHDAYGDEEELPNLFRFDKSWTYYELGEDVVICGIEMAKGNAHTLYSDLNLDPHKTNIAMLHGSTSFRMATYEIYLKALEGKNIDYLALGHIHKASGGKLDSRGYYAYSGSMEPRGYDEEGKHGFRLLNVEGGVVQSDFVPFASREIRTLDIEIPLDRGDAYQAPKIVLDELRKINGPRNIYRINLVGDKDEDSPEIVNDVLSRLEGSGLCAYAEVRDYRVPKLDIESLNRGESLVSEFVRQVMDSDLPEADKKETIALGLRALKGEL